MNTTFKILPIKFYTCVILIIPAFNAHSLPGKRFTYAEVKSELINHQWTLAQVNETSHDTVTNVTIMLMPCEKDNILKYDANNTYQIIEGVVKCNPSDDNIKGQGSWEYNENDSSIADRYAGGREVEKKIIELNDGLFKVQYEGEGKKIITLTYLSETGTKDETKKEQVVDNSDPASVIMQLVRENLLAENNYSLIGLTGFRNETVQPVENNSPVKKIAVIPLADLTNANETVNVSQRNSELIEQGKKSGTDYIVTGTLIRAVTQTGNDGKPYGEIKYSINVLDVNKGKERARDDFEYPDKKKVNGSIFLNKVGKTAGIVGVVGVGAVLVSALGKQSAVLGSLFALYFVSRAVSVSNNSYGSVFSNVNSEERKKHYESSMSLVQAIDKTEPDLKKFLKRQID